MIMWFLGLFFKVKTMRLSHGFFMIELLSALMVISLSLTALMLWYSQGVTRYYKLVRECAVLEKIKNDSACVRMCASYVKAGKMSPADLIENISYRCTPLPFHETLPDSLRNFLDEKKQPHRPFDQPLYKVSIVQASYTFEIII